MEYSQCTNEKCLWVGTGKEYLSIPSTNPTIKDVGGKDHVCPNCGNDEFYVLSEDEYNKLKEK